jgi:hypothetical protein
MGLALPSRSKQPLDMDNIQTIQCPWCWEELELYIDPETEGTMVEDCAVCCRPWQVHVYRESGEKASVLVTRSN